MQKQESWYEKIVIENPARKITADTKDYLHRTGLWDKPSLWTTDTMRHLALSREEAGTIPCLSFEQVFFAVKSFAPERIVPLMNEYALAVQAIGHIKDAFEYAIQYRQAELLTQLIEWHKENKSLTEWRQVYQLLLEVLQENISDEETIDKARDLTGYVTESLLKMRLESLEIRSYLRLGYYPKTASLRERMNKQLKHIKPSFAKSVTMSRAGFQIAYDLLYNQGKAKEAEQYLLDCVLDEVMVDAMCSACYHLLSYTALLRPSYVCLGYMQRSIAYAERAGLKEQVQVLSSQGYPFVCNVHGERFDLADVDPEEQVYQHIVRGNNEKALQLAEELERDEKGSTCLIFYKGIASGDVTLLAEAMRCFAEENRIHLLPLVERELVKVSSPTVKGEV
ncbi:AimR family lysis-lysogeny pheromone receptor [Bacillus sp. FSL W7-1360]